MNEACELYDAIIRENLERRLPVSMEELKTQHKLAKHQALASLKGKNDGLLLNKHCKARLANLQQQNESQAQVVCSNFINKEFVSIQRRMSSNEYRSILEFERDIKLFYQFLLEHGPKTVLKQQVYQDFYQKMMNEGAQMFIRSLNQDLSNVKSSSEEQLRQQESRMKEMREEKEREMKELVQRYQYSEKEDVQKVKKMQEQFNEERKRLMEQVREHKLKVSDLEEKLKHNERQQLLRESEHQKQTALLEQRIQQMLRQHEQKEQLLDTSIVSTRSEYSNQLKDVSNKYENMVQVLTDKNKQLNDKLQTQIELTHKNETQFDIIQSKFQQREQSLIIQLDDAILTIQRLKSELASKKDDDVVRNRYEDELREMKKFCDSLEQQLREKQEKQLQVRQNLEKEKALLEQENQFLEMQCEDAKQQLLQQKRSHEQMMSLLQTNNQQSSNNNKQILEMKENHMNDVKQLEQGFDSQKQQLLSQIEKLKAQSSEESSKLRVRFQQENESLRETVSQKNKQVKELEEKMQTRQREWEAQVKELKNVVWENEQKYEEEVQQLKSRQELERERLERRLQEEKLSYERNLNEQLEDLDQKQRDEINIYEEELNQLRSEISDQEGRLMQMRQQYTNEKELKEKQLSNLESINRELKESIHNQYVQQQQQYEAQIRNYQAEMRELSAKVEQQQDELFKKEQEIMQTVQTKNELEDLYQNKDFTYEQKKQDWEHEKQAIYARNQDLKNQLDALQDEYLQKKIHLEKNLALTSQQNDFLREKLDSLQTQLDQAAPKYDQLIRHQLQEQAAQYDLKLNTLTLDLEDARLKIEKLKQILKDSEVQSRKLLSELESDNSRLNERVIALEIQFEQQEHLYQDQISKLKENYSNQPRIQPELEKLKQEVLFLEADKSEIQANYERDAALWQGKFRFLSDQRDQAKNDLQEAMTKFEQTLITLQQSKAMDNDDEDSSLAQMLSSMEKKYQLQLQDLQENYQNRINEQEQRIYNLENQLKQQYEAQFSDLQGKLNEQVYSERKIQELLRQEQLYQEEIEMLKRELNGQKGLDAVDWGGQKDKIQQLEDQLKQVEKKRSNMIFEHEKERSRWNLEKDQLVQQRNELQELVNRQEKKKETLQKEIEKLRGSTKSSRFNNFAPSNTYSTRRSPSKSPLESNRILISHDSNSFEMVKSQIQEQYQQEQVGQEHSFEMYYQQMQQRIK